MLTIDEEEKIINLLMKLVGNKSSKEHFELITDFCLNSPPLATLTAEKKLLLIEKSKIIRDEHSERGRKYALLNKNLKKRKVFSHPAFFELIPNGKCEICERDLTNNPGFIWKEHETKWHYYCPIPDCFPKEHKEKMIKNYIYINWKKT